MKLFSYFFTGALIALMLNSCSENDELKNGNQELIGSWMATEINFEGNSAIETTGNIVSTSFSGDGYNMALQIRFDENSNEFTSFGAYNIHLNTNHHGHSSITEWMNPGFIQCGKWNKNGNDLLITNHKGETQSATILSLDQQRLVLSYNFTYKTKQFDSSVTYEVGGIFTFEKQLVNQ